MWPRHLANHFSVVYTFEPDPQNFYCLSHNVKNTNVFKFQAGLGDIGKQAGLMRYENNSGAHRLYENGFVPVLRLDDLSLFACDFLQLDVEGYEYLALKGAGQTILKHNPVIMIEQKGKEELYGFRKKQSREYLEGIGYVLKERLNRDMVFTRQ